jgi:hypothetical protein
MMKKKNALTQANANKLREKIIGLTVQETKCQLEVAEAVYELYYGTVAVGNGELPLYKFFGYPSWFAYVEEEVGLHVTTAASYRMVHDVFMIQLKGKWDASLIPSFTKMKALTRVVDAKNVNAWLRKAKRLSCCALEEEILEALYGKQKKGANRHFLAMLTDRQFTAVNSIIEIGRQEFPDLETRGEVLTKILEQWDAAVAKKTKRGLRIVKSA